jgi:hypothetical protein
MEQTKWRLNDSTARVSAYNVTDVRYPIARNLTLLNTWDRELAAKFHPGADVDVRLLYRHDMIELYLEDYLMAVYSFVNATGSVSSGSVALFNADGGDSMYYTSRYRLLLPAQQPLPRADTPKAQCSNDQDSQYVEPHFEPSLDDAPALGIELTFRLHAVKTLRAFNASGIYAAETIGIRGDNGLDGPSGYFGTLVFGNQPCPPGSASGHAKLCDTMLFSFWDANAVNGSTTETHAYALPMTPSCHRNCEDCSRNLTDGTQCAVNIPQLEEGDSILYHLERGAVSTAMYSGRKVTGRLWRVTTETTHFNGTVGVMLMEESRDTRSPRPAEGHKPPGVVSTGMFHEHLGGTKCRSFEVREEREGPFPVMPRAFAVDGETLPAAAASSGVPPVLAELRNMTGAYPCMVNDDLTEKQ